MVYRAAVVGCGLIGSRFADDPLIAGIHSHAGAYSASSLAALAAVCDGDAARAIECGERWGVPHYQDVVELLAEEEPDLVSVATPDETHYEVLRTVISAPSVRGVLAEKPLALSMEQAREIATLADERGVVLAINYIRRYAVSHRKLKHFLDSGGIGEIQTVAAYYTKGTLHNASHWFDLGRFLVGEIVRAWGHDALGEGGSDPSLDAFLEFGSGAGFHLHGCRASAFAMSEFDLVGTRGRVQIRDAGHTFATHAVADSPQFSGYRSLVPVDGPAGGLEDVLLHAVDDLARAVDEGRRPLCSAADGIAAMRIALAVRESARTGSMVELGGEGG